MKVQPRMTQFRYVNFMIRCNKLMNFLLTINILIRRKKILGVFFWKPDSQKHVSFAHRNAGNTNAAGNKIAGHETQKKLRKKVLIICTSKD